MAVRAKLALEDGTVYTGCGFGAEGEVDGEVCFNTSMTGYQEILTDPSYRGQIVAMTYPEIGNYGVNTQDVESAGLHLAGFVVRKAGLNPQSDVNIVPVGSGPTWLAALENRKVDVALTAPPTPDTAISRGYAILFINNAKGEDPSISEFLMENLIVRPETAAKDQDTVRRMVRALTRANQWAVKSTPEQVADALKPSMTTIAPELLLAGVKAVLPTLSSDGRTSEKSVQITQDVLEQAGILKKRAPYAELVSNDFLAK